VNNPTKFTQALNVGRFIKVNRAIEKEKDIGNQATKELEEHTMF